MSNYCSAPNCKNKNSDSIVVFKCPEDSRNRDLWKQVLVSYGKKEEDIKKTIRLCQNHFRQEDIIIIKGKNCLKKEAIPLIKQNEDDPPKKVKKIDIVSIENTSIDQPLIDTLFNTIDNLQQHLKQERMNVQLWRKKYLKIKHEQNNLNSGLKKYKNHYLSSIKI